MVSFSSASTCPVSHWPSFGGVEWALRSVVVLHGFNSGVPLLDERKLLTVTLGELNQRLLALTDGEDVAETGGECLALGVLDVDDLVGTGVVLNMHEGTDTTNIVTSDNEDSSSVFEFNNAVDFAGLKVKLNVSMKSIKYNHFGKKRIAKKKLTLIVSFFLMSG